MEQRIETKVGIFIIGTSFLIIAAIGYVAYKKDVFSKVYTYTLSSTTGENITKGMPVLFWGFNIGKVSDMELTDTGVLVKIKIPERNNRVIRADSQFVLEKPLLGTPRIIVNTSNLKGPPLSGDIFPKIVVSNDINELIKKGQTIAEQMNVVADNLKTTINNVTTITDQMADPNGELGRIMKNAEAVTARFAKDESLIEMVTGDQKSTEMVLEFIKNAQDISVRTNTILKKFDALTDKTDESIYGEDGLLLLLKGILENLLVTLENFNQISGNAANATEDLSGLRDDVDEAVGAVRTLLDNLDRILQLKEESKIELP